MLECVIWNAALFHQDVESAEAAHHFRHHLAAVRGVLDIAGHAQAFHARLLDPARGLVGIGVFHAGHVAQRDVGAFAREGDRHRAADAAVRAGDERLASLQPAVTFVGLLTMVGLRPHFLLGARRLLLLLGKRLLQLLLARILRGGGGHGFPFEAVLAGAASGAPTGGLEAGLVRDFFGRG